MSLAADIHVECTNTMNYPVYQIPSKVVVGMASYPHGALNHAIFVVKQKNELFIGLVMDSWKNRLKNIKGKKYFECSLTDQCF